jgi:hypothetical protein
MAIRAFFALFTITAVLSVHNVQAQGIPPEGPVSVTFTATPIPPPIERRGKPGAAQYGRPVSV